MKTLTAKPKRVDNRKRDRSNWRTLSPYDERTPTLSTHYIHKLTWSEFDTLDILYRIADTRWCVRDNLMNALGLNISGFQKRLERLRSNGFIDYHKECIDIGSDSLYGKNNHHYRTTIRINKEGLEAYFKALDYLDCWIDQSMDDCEFELQEI
jgi:hypothetical protein